MVWYPLMATLDHLAYLILIKGKSTNLAPFSYTQVIKHDPPLFTIGFAGGFSSAKDTLANLTATKECTINIVSEHFIEAANAASINAPVSQNTSF